MLSFLFKKKKGVKLNLDNFKKSIANILFIFQRIS
jgi:hypothetical protein